MRYAPLTLELELINSSTEPIISDLDDARPFTAADTSRTWEIQNVQVKVDLLILDNGLDNSYASYLLRGEILPISFT